MEIILGGWQQVSNRDLVDQGYKARLNYELVEKEGEMAEHFRCPICGVGMTYDFKERDKMIAQGRWDYDKDRPQHCGSSLCYDYLEECWKDRQDKSEQLFMALRKKGLVA